MTNHNSRKTLANKDLPPEEKERRRRIYEHLMAHKEEILREAMVEAAEIIAREVPERSESQETESAPAPAKS
ncbi:MAG: hypothetical protein ACE5JM_16845 [Armatimonadota bacterium]